MTRLTITLDDDLLATLQSLAATQQVSMDQFLRDHLHQAFGRSEARRTALEKIRASMKNQRIHLGSRGWRREDLYER